MKKRVILRFKKSTINKPIVYRLIRDYDLIFNILRANVSPKAESVLVLEVEGTDENYAKGIEYLRTWNIDIAPIEQDIYRDEERCVHCGLCTSVCATDALDIDRETMRVRFDYEKCVACELCVKICPVKAMNVYFT